MLVFVLGQFIYLTHSLSLWHYFSIVYAPKEASPSGIGFSKLGVTHIRGGLLFSLLLHRNKKEYLCLDWIVSLCFRLQS